MSRVTDSVASEMDEDDELDELLDLLDEEEQVESEKKAEQTEQKKEYESELYVCSKCKLRVDPLTRAISSEHLELRLRRWSILSLINLPFTHSQHSNEQFVIIGILAAKIIKTSKKNDKYLLIKIDDFKASISCFIFNKEIIEKFYKIAIGTVLAVAKPKVIDNNNNKQKQHPSSVAAHRANEVDLALRIEEMEQILIVGKSIDFGFCNKPIKNGSETCKSVVNKSESDLCLFHKHQQYKRYASKRNDTNRCSLSSNLRNKNTKKNLSKVTMSQMMKPSFLNKSSNVHQTNVYLANRKKNNMVHKHRNTVQMRENEKKQQMNQLLRGKTLIPQLGTNWNRNSNANRNIVLAPRYSSKRAAGTDLEITKSQQRAQQLISAKGIKFDAPDPNNTANLQSNHNEHRSSRKRSFQCMTTSENDGTGVSPKRKRSRLSDVVKEGEMEEIINQKSKNDTLRKQVEKEQLFTELDDLQNEEKLHDELENVTSVQTTIYVCKFQGCALKNKPMEQANTFCKSHAVNIVKSSGRKYFWKCDNCKYKTSTINTKRIKCKCAKCGRKKFVPASVYNLSTPKSNGEQKLILVNNKRA